MATFSTYGLSSNSIRELPPIERQELLCWVGGHDWGHDAHYCDGLITDLSDSYTLNGEIIEIRQSFDSVNDLLSWAGY